MSEFDRCPDCGGKLDYYVSGEEGKGDPIWYECLEVGCYFRCNGKSFPKISAAMKFTDAAIWADECEETHEWLDDTSENINAYNSSRLLEAATHGISCECFKKAVEVWENE